MKTIMIKTKSILKIGVFSIVILSLLISPILKSYAVPLSEAAEKETCDSIKGICLEEGKCGTTGEYPDSVVEDPSFSCPDNKICCRNVKTPEEYNTNVTETISENPALKICGDTYPGQGWGIENIVSPNYFAHKVCLFQVGIIEGLGKMFAALINLQISMIFWAFDPDTYGGFVLNPGVEEVSDYLINLVNLVLILGLVFIAIATILGIKKYSWQQTLWKLIVVALLVNFSLVIAGMVLDVSHFLAYNFLTLAKKESTTIADKMIATFNATSTLDSDIKYDLSFMPGTQLETNTNTGTKTLKSGWGLSWGNFFIVTILLLIIGIFVLIALLAVFVTMMLRSGIIIALLALSPVAFTAWIFPDTEKYWKMWWQQFIKWCTYPILFAFMLWIGISVVTNLEPGSNANLGIVSFFVRMFLFSMFLVGGLIFSVQGGGATAQFVMKQGSKLALGLGSAGLGFALGRIVNSGWYNKIAEKLSAKEGKLGEKPILGAITRPISAQLYKLKGAVSATRAKKEEEELKAISGEENALTNYVISARRLGKTTSALKALKIKADNAFEFTDAERQFMVQLPERFGGTEEARRIYKYNAAVRIDKSTGKPIAPLHVATRYNLSPASEMNVEEVIKTLGANAQDFLANTQYGILQTASTIRQIAKFIQDIPASHLERFLIYLSKNVFGTPQKPISLHEWLSNNNKPIATLIENPPKGGRESDLASLITTVWNTK